jgi:hypothetical protein
MRSNIRIWTLPKKQRLVLESDIETVMDRPVPYDDYFVSIFSVMVIFL